MSTRASGGVVGASAINPGMSDPVAPPDAFDVVIVGGGAIGCAVAAFLLDEPAFEGRVAIIERDPTYREASSALSASSIRQQFSTPENIRMSRFGFEFLRALGEGPDPVDVGLEERGYLYLAPTGGAATLREVHAIQEAEGAQVALLSPAELTARFPWISTDGIEAGALGLAGEGWFDGFGLLQALRRQAVTRGAEMIRDEVVGLVRGASGIESVTLASGRIIGCGTVVNAAGPWARDVAAMAGIDLPVEARRRCVFVFNARDPLPDCPLVIDTSGLWFRPEGESFIVGTSPSEDVDFDRLPLEVNWSEFHDLLWPALAARVPAFDAIKPVRAWAGYYEYNVVDQNAIIGRHPELTNLVFANGFSGHGIQQAPAVGRAVSELIAHGRFTTIDLAVFGYERFAAGRPVIERNVIG
jgi:glycine/D-amino acid oxidase-like deaminating enzyme